MEFFNMVELQNISFPKEITHPVIMELLNNYTSGIVWNVTHNAPEGCIVIGNATPAERKEHEYVLNITTNGIYINGKDYNSLIRGFVTFLDKIVCHGRKQYRVDCCCLLGTPAVSFRSVHLCVFPETTLEFLNRSVRACAIGKYSHIILEFWGTLKFDCMKELAWPTAYTKEQIKAIVQEANALGMEVIPFYQHLGHAAMSRCSASGKHVVLDQNLEYEYLYMPDSFSWVWDFTKPEVRDLLRKVRDELMDVCGKGSYFHIGCDESPSLELNGHRGLDICEYLNEVQRELEEKGRRAIIWGDMLLSDEYFTDVHRRTEGNIENTYQANSGKDFVDSIMNNLNKKIMIADWQYVIYDEEWQSAKMFKKCGFDVICGSWSNIGNIHTSVNTVVNNDLYGTMKTTWATLDREMPHLFYAGICAWEGHILEEPSRVWSIMPEKTSQMFRKVWHSGGNYERSGWSEKQIGIGR